MRFRTLAAMTLLPLALAGTAQAKTITVVNHANVRPWVLQRVEQAVTAQVNGPVHQAWHTPLIKFGPGGWRLTLVYSMYNLPFPEGCDWHGDAQGCHSYLLDASQTPFMVISTWKDSWSDGMPPQWTQAVSHEIIETLTDKMPTNHVGEVCDNTGDSAYQVNNGVILADFLTPSGHVGAEIS